MQISKTLEVFCLVKDVDETLDVFLWVVQVKCYKVGGHACDS